MHQLNQSVYSSLRDYQETYEFYRTRQEVPKSLNSKVIQTIWNPDVINQIKAS